MSSKLMFTKLMYLQNLLLKETLSLVSKLVPNTFI